MRAEKSWLCNRISIINLQDLNMTFKDANCFYQVNIELVHKIRRLFSPSNAYYIFLHHAHNTSDQQTMYYSHGFNSF